MNDIVLSQDTLEKFSALERPTEQEGPPPVQFLKYLHKEEFWQFGAENNKPQMAEKDDRTDGDQFVANVRDTLSHGWICWKDSRPFKTTTDPSDKEGQQIPTMVPISQGVPLEKHQLDDHGPYEKDKDGNEIGGWKENFSIDLFDPVYGGVLLYEANTVFGRKTLQDLGVAYANQMKKGAVKFCHPMVTLGTGKFSHKKKDRPSIQIIPIITVVDWVNDAHQTEAQVTAQKAPKTIEGEVIDVTPTRKEVSF